MMLESPVPRTCAPCHASNELPPKVAGVQGKRLRDDQPYPDPKGNRNKSMVGKQGTAEDVYAVALQRLHPMARAELLKSKCPAVKRHILR
jgi:hypothetical protein